MTPTSDARERVLVAPAALAERLTSGPGDLILADVRWNLAGPPGRPEYEAGHLPGAVWVDLETELAGPPGDGGRHPLPNLAVLAALVRRLGISDDTDVVVYDGATSLSAARLWWLLTDAGHGHVRVLDGGYAGWVAGGRPVETGPGCEPSPGGFVPHPGHRGAYRAEDIVVAEGTLALVDVRAPERFTGATEPMDPVAGHIPGAVNRPSMANLDADRRFRRSGEILAAYEDLEAPVFYCGSGITAAHSLLALESAGRHDGRIYPGSWSDWIQDPERSVATGE